MAEAPFLGIDFGTTNSSVGAVVDAAPARVLRDGEGRDKTPSLVYYGDRETLVGTSAADMLADGRGDPQVHARLIHSIKRRLVDPPRLAVPGRSAVRPVDVVAEIMGKLKRDAEEALEAPVGRVVVTCPSLFDGDHRAALVEASTLAGFSEVELAEEPVAAAMAFEHDGGRVGRGVLVYDFGGGTFDVALVARDEVDDRFYVALDPDGDDCCGGDDLDQRLYAYFDEQARQQLGRSISPDPGRLDVGFLLGCRRRKENLSTSRHAVFSTLLSGGEPFQSRIDRETFEELIADLVSRTIRITERVAARAAEAGTPVDTVLLIGGSSQVPLVQRQIAEVLHLKPLTWRRRDVAVALGAAYQARLIWGGSRAASPRPAVNGRAAPDDTVPAALPPAPPDEPAAVAAHGEEPSRSRRRRDSVPAGRARRVRALGATPARGVRALRIAIAGSVHGLRTGTARSARRVGAPVRASRRLAQRRRTTVGAPPSGRRSVRRGARRLAAAPRAVAGPLAAIRGRLAIVARKVFDVLAAGPRLVGRGVRRIGEAAAAHARPIAAAIVLLAVAAAVLLLL